MVENVKMDKSFAIIFHLLIGLNYPKMNNSTISFSAEYIQDNLKGQTVLIIKKSAHKFKFDLFNEIGNSLLINYYYYYCQIYYNSIC